MNVSLNNPRRPSMPRLVAALALALVLITAGCSATAAGSSEPAVDHYQALVFDVSGSVRKTGATDGYDDRAAQLIRGAPDGTTFALVVADGSSLTSVCIPRTVQLKGEGPNRVQKQDDLDADRERAREVLHEQLRCGRERATGGSDLIGAILAADRAVPPDMPPVSVTLFSDGLQASKDLTLGRPMLTDHTGQAAAVTHLKSSGLLPTHLAGATLKITDPGVGAKLTAAQAAGITAFWSRYAGAADMALA